jgi:hypothetical protein
MHSYIKCDFTYHPSDVLIKECIYPILTRNNLISYSFIFSNSELRNFTLLLKVVKENEISTINYLNDNINLFIQKKTLDFGESMGSQKGAKTLNSLFDIFKITKLYPGFYEYMNNNPAIIVQHIDSLNKILSDTVLNFLKEDHNYSAIIGFMISLHFSSIKVFFFEKKKIINIYDQLIDKITQIIAKNDPNIKRKLFLSLANRYQTIKKQIHSLICTIWESNINYYWTEDLFEWVTLFNADVANKNIILAKIIDDPKKHETETNCSQYIFENLIQHLNTSLEVEAIDVIYIYYVIRHSISELYGDIQTIKP